jgi:hypothetical protein
MIRGSWRGTRMVDSDGLFGNCRMTQYDDNGGAAVC